MSIFVFILRYSFFTFILKQHLFCELFIIGLLAQIEPMEINALMATFLVNFSVNFAMVIYSVLAPNFDFLVLVIRLPLTIPSDPLLVLLIRFINFILHFNLLRFILYHLLPPHFNHFIRCYRCYLHHRLPLLDSKPAFIVIIEAVGFIYGYFSFVMDPLFVLYYYKLIIIQTYYSLFISM